MQNIKNILMALLLFLSMILSVKKNYQVWGAYTGNTAESFLSFQNEVGKQANINAVFLNFGDPFPNDLANFLKNKNQTLLIFWEPGTTTLQNIINGEHDNYIKTFAMQIKNYKNSVILVPMPEMNGNWDVWDGSYGTNSPAEVVLAWKHIHGFFSGVTNVKFGWDVNNNSVPDTPENAINNYYPGANYVDYVGVDGFNFGNPWQSYSDIFSSALQQLKTYKKPIYIFSMACAEAPQKADWISDALNKIKSDSNISGWVWFNENKEQNWLVNSNPAALQAFVQEIKN